MLSFDIPLPNRLSLSLFVLINNIFAIAVLVEVMSYEFNGILNLAHSREINLSKFGPFKGDKPL